MGDHAIDAGRVGGGLLGARAEVAAMRVTFGVAEDCAPQPNLFHRNVIRDFTG